MEWRGSRPAIFCFYGKTRFSDRKRPVLWIKRRCRSLGRRMIPVSKLLRVLVVEDSEDDTLLLLRELKQSGYQPVHERVDTAEAMISALERREWDIVIADHNMPRFSSTEALALVQKKGIDLPFIIVSGSIGEEFAVSAMKAGAQDYLIKGNLRRLTRRRARTPGSDGAQATQASRGRGVPPRRFGPHGRP